VDKFTILIEFRDADDRWTATDPHVVTAKQQSDTTRTVLLDFLTDQTPEYESWRAKGWRGAWIDSTLPPDDEIGPEQLRERTPPAVRAAPKRVRRERTTGPTGTVVRKVQARVVALNTRILVTADPNNAVVQHSRGDVFAARDQVGAEPAEVLERVETYGRNGLVLDLRTNKGWIRQLDATSPVIPAA
jgi:hypothetical protein